MTLSNSPSVSSLQTPKNFRLESPHQDPSSPPVEPVATSHHPSLSSRTNFPNPNGGSRWLTKAGFALGLTVMVVGAGWYAKEKGYFAPKSEPVLTATATR